MNEQKRALTDPYFRIAIVTDAKGKAPKLYSYSGKELIRCFTFNPIAFIASRDKATVDDWDEIMHEVWARQNKDRAKVRNPVLAERDRRRR